MQNSLNRSQPRSHNDLLTLKKRMARTTRLLIPLISLALGSACTSLEAPLPYANDESFLGTLGEPIARRVLGLAPLRTSYKPRSFTLEAERLPANDPTGLKAIYRPPVPNSEQQRLVANISKDIEFSTRGGRVINLAGTASELDLDPALDPASIAPLDSSVNASSDSSSLSQSRIRALCREAEERGAELMMTLELRENRIGYRGTDSGWTLDLLMTIFFLPLEMYVHDEVFEAHQELAIELYDVRSPEQALYTDAVSADFSWSCDETEHGYIFLNAFSSEDNIERFSSTNWQAVDKLIRPHLDEQLRRALVSRLRGALRDRLETPELRAQIEKGRPDKARLYLLLLAPDLDDGLAEVYSSDAAAISELFIARCGVTPAHAISLTGAACSAEQVLKNLRELPTKAVDRLVLFYAGRGTQDASGEALAMSKGSLLPLNDLATTLKSRPLGDVAFILDCGFGARERSQLYKGRTLNAPKARDASLQPQRFLGALTSNEGWRVLCAADHNATAPTWTDEGHGLLTWLLLEELRDLNPDKPAPRLEERLADLRDRQRRIARSLLGEPSSLAYKAAAGARPFVLAKIKIENSSTESKSPDSANPAPPEPQ